MWRHQHAGLLAAAGLVLGVLVVLPAPAAGASGPVCMAVVVDDGNGATSAAQTADVASGTTDLQALSDVGDTPTQNDAGLICAIGGYPANGLQNCLATSGSLYDFWSYWEGDPYTNTWTYAQVGPASHEVTTGDTYVEGWRYQDPGPDNATATKPALTPAAAFGQACPGVSPVASSSGGGGSAGGPSGGGAGAGGGATTPTTTTDPTTPPTAEGSTGSTPAKGSVDAAGPGGASGSAPSTTTTPAKAGAGGSSAGTDADKTTTTVAAGTGGAHRTVAKLALSDAASHGRSGGDATLPIVAVAVLIALLAGLAWFRWRRRPAEE